MDEFGEFVDFVIFEDVPANATSWRSQERLDPGTYYVHVSGIPRDCFDCPDEWSNVLKLVIPKPLKYAGKTAQDKRVAFTVGPRRKQITEFKFSVRTSCPNNHKELFDVWVYGILLAADGTFNAQAPLKVGSFNGTVWVSGALLNTVPKTAKGSLRVKLSKPSVGTCDSGKVKWSATRT